ncbi:unnamed protein product [Medioppia subpectinata]|uniref:K Homology domain-containing protein n=1 Tax=Medioppia subpectinata TaxID=1979941 RepID=A0A7R9PYH8_9ACAR|nr:unnamed protein product [Medioppia subpectinata]CAG2105427.1 unnamed protein product [Medioppia subpectinata]
MYRSNNNNNNNNNNNSAERDVELRLLIHTSHAGGIIGKGGQRIRDLRDQTKAAIKVFSQCCPMSTERICAVQGGPALVIEAIKIVLNIIISSPIKGPVKLYDPYNFDVYCAQEYGGYTDPGPTNFRGGRGGGGGGPNMPFGRGGGPRMGRMPDRRGGSGHWQQEPPSLPPIPDGWAARMPFNGPADRRPHNQMYSSRWLTSDNPRSVPPPTQSPQVGAETPYWSDVIPNDSITTGAPIHSSNSWSTPYSAANNEPNFGPNSGEDVSNLVENSDGSASATISVPNNVAGAIIGKGGNRIRLVRRDSGADIAIDSAVGPGNERMITVKGNAHQVRMACSMIHKSIAENTRLRHKLYL